MSSTKFLIALTVVLFFGCAQYGLAADIGPAVSTKTVDNNADQLDQAAIMQMCNESFRISMGTVLRVVRTK